MASLLTIPLEILISISSYLPTSDLGSLRLSCKQAEKSIYEWFATEFFAKKQFMLTHASLQTLVDISRHVSFSKKLTHLIIATNVYDNIPLRFRDDEAAIRYIQGFEGQKSLLSTGYDREMLTEAFQNLVNLHTVGIRDFNAGSRYRDGKNASWSSWGATTVYRETGIQLQFSDRGSFQGEIGTRFVSRLFTSVLYALGKADRNPPEVEVLLRQQGLPDSAFFLPEFIMPDLQPVLHGLTSLLLNIDLGASNLHTHSSGTSTDSNPGRALRNFLAHTPNLKHLRLNFQKHMVPYNEPFLEWLAQATPSAGQQGGSFLDPAPVALPALRQLELGQLSVRPNIIVAVISKFAPTVTDISLWRMGLHSGALHPSTPKPNLWAELFRTLGRTSTLHLEHFKVGMLQQDSMYVHFNATGGGAGRPEKVMQHSGKDMGKFLANLVERCTVDWPVIVDNETDDSNSDEDMEDDDDEDEDADGASDGEDDDDEEEED